MRRERVIALSAAVLLVIFRSLPFALYEQIQFDSDQAIFGLMAKHLAEGRAFPLFMYGNPYLLAVEAWLTTPWFVVAPHTLFTLSLSLILINVAAGALLILALSPAAGSAGHGLRPWYAVAAAVFFLLPPPIVAGDLVSVSGGNVEPFLYVTLLWMLRKRPLWFGAVLALGVLQREFTIYAIPMLLAADALRGRLFAPANMRRWLLAVVMFLAVWESVHALQPYADLMGPGTRGQLLGGFEASQVGNVVDRVNLRPAQIPSRLEGMARIYLPRVLGATRYDARVPSSRRWLELFLLAAIVAGTARIGRLAWRQRARVRTEILARAAFSWYLLGIGLTAGAVFVLTHPVTEEYARYGLLMVLIPAGLAGVLLSLEPGGRARAIVLAVVAGWAVVPAADTFRLYTYYRDAPPADVRVLADTLVGRGVRNAYAGYWTAYVVTFMAGERVKVASSDFVRIAEYQLLANESPDTIDIREQPCAGGEKVARWYFCRPGQE